MADVSAALKDWSATTASNSPAGGTTIGTGLDDNLREIQGAIVRGLSNKGSDIASATTTDLGAVEGLMHDITGTTTITGFGTVRAGIWKIIKFEGALTLTHNATSLILPGAANITTADGDIAIVISEGSGNWRCVAYVKATGKAIIAPAVGDVTGLGTGVATALAVNVGSAGAPVVNGGALGTPTSGDITNLAATQAQMEAVASLAVAVTPGRQQFHVGHPKAWVRFDGTGTPAITATYQGSSITDNGTGDYTVNVGVTFSAASAVCALWTAGNASASDFFTTCPFNANFGTSSVRGAVFTGGRALADVSNINVVFFGDLT